MFAAPEGVEFLHEGKDEAGIVGQDPGFPVAAVVVFGTDAGSGEVGAAEVGAAAVNDYGFGVQPGAEHALELLPGEQLGKTVEILAESWTGFLGVHESDGNSGTDQFGEHRQKRDKASAPGDVQVLQIGGGDPEKFSRLGDLLHDETGVVITV